MNLNAYSYVATVFVVTTLRIARDGAEEQPLHIEKDA
jgi:hypothetical protein